MQFYKTLFLCLALLLNGCGGGETTTSRTTGSSSPATSPSSGEVLVSGIVLSARDIDDGSSQQVGAVVSPSNASNKALNWSVSDSAIASINSNGQLTPKKAGKVTVIATATDGSGVSGKVDVTISFPAPSAIPVSSIRLTASDIDDGSSQQIGAVVSPSNASNKALNWSVNDSAIASINSNGQLTPKKAGKVTVTATATDGSGVSGKVDVTISFPAPSAIPVSSIVLSASDIDDGSSQQIGAVVSPSNASNKGLNWSVSDSGIASIDSKGKLTPKKAGKVTVTAAAADGSGVSGTVNVSISFPAPSTVLVSSIVLTASTINDGLPQQIGSVVNPSNAENKALTWSVDDGSIASIDSRGLLTPKKDGTVKVTATASDDSGVTGTVDVQIQLLGTVVNSSAGLLSAIANASSGSTIYLRGRNYAFNQTIDLDKNGSSSSRIGLRGYPYDSSRPKLDFSAMSENSSNRGVILSGDYWHIYGIDFYKAGDNCMNVSGNHNIIEFATFSECADTGLQLGKGASNNLVLNSDSYFNADASNENADGFAVKLDVGSGNKFVGCRAWNNLDDGWDGYLRPSNNISTTYENCWAIDNGKDKNGNVGKGDGNGFKTGGSDDKDLKHHAVYKQCIAAGNTHDGFDHNSNRGNVTLLNCAAHANGRNIAFLSDKKAASLTIKNTISFDNGDSDKLYGSTTDIAYNSWQNGISVSSADFESVNTQLLKSARKADGSLPDIDYLKLKAGSDLIDAGDDVGLPFNGNHPDIGPFESD